MKSACEYDFIIYFSIILSVPIEFEFYTNIKVTLRLIVYTWLSANSAASIRQILNAIRVFDFSGTILTGNRYRFSNR